MKKRNLLTVGATLLVLGFASGVVINGTISANAEGTTEFPMNSSGETFGSAAGTTPETEPDLILVALDDGTEGYIRSAALRAVNGSEVSTPAEAMAYEEAREAGRVAPLDLPVYDVEGETVIGTFTPNG